MRSFFACTRIPHKNSSIGFDTENRLLTIKVTSVYYDLDSRPANGHFWLYSSPTCFKSNHFFCRV